MEITEQHIEQAEGYDTLGPAYFASRDIVGEYMATLNGDRLKELAKTFSDKIYEETQAAFEDFLLGDAALNLQGRLYRMVDDCVEAILGGKQWVLQKYVLGKYNCEEIRAAVAKFIPMEVMEQRMIDLTAENERLKSALDFERRSRY